MAMQISRTLGARLGAWVMINGTWYKKHRPLIKCFIWLSDKASMLLEELVLLKSSFERQDIGPRTYEQTQRLLLDSLARLESQ